MPRLWFTPSDVPALRRRATRGWHRDVADAALALAEQPAADPTKPEAQFLVVESNALAFTLTGRRVHARRTLAAVRALLADTTDSDLRRSFLLLGACIGYDLTGAAWSRAERREVATRAGALARRLASTTICPGNPDNPFNNWWGVTHSSAALTALCFLPEDATLAPLLTQEHERVRTYLLNYGDAGHYYEGTGYGFYALSHWGPYVLAARHALGRDAGDLAPGLAALPRLAHALTVARPKLNDSDDPAFAGGRGMRVTWNDDGGQWPALGTPALLLALAPARERASLRWLHDRLGGPQGDRSAAAPARGLLWEFLFCPSRAAARAPRGPLLIHDQRTGLVVFRDRYRDGDDCVFAAYAKTYHGGGHVQEDLGSWRFQGLGAGWAQAGGQAKAAAHFQCVVTRDGQPNSGKHGQISYLAPGTAGGSVSLRLGPASGSKAWDRHFAVDYSRASGADAVVALVDECWHDAEADWTWSLCFERQLEFALLPEENGFSLAGPAGARLVVRFAAPAQLAFTVHESPASERHFSGGMHRVYPGARYVTATVRGARVNFFAVATLQRGAAPALRVRPAAANALPAVELGGTRIALALGKWFHGPLRIEPRG
jgi:hypothetical protein